MAVDELQEYLLNGTIINSVNYPNVDAGACHSAGRILVLHKNIPNMITKFTAVTGDAGINVSAMTNKSKGEYAVTVLDIDTPMPADVAERLTKAEGVFRIRILK